MTRASSPSISREATGTLKAIEVEWATFERIVSEAHREGAPASS